MIYLIAAFKYLVVLVFSIFIVGLVIGALIVIVVDYEWKKSNQRWGSNCGNN